MMTQELRKPAGENVLALLKLRAYAYDVLRRTFSSEPSLEYLVLMKENIHEFPFAYDSEDILNGLKRVEESLAEGAEISKEQQEALIWDYTRMFIGPYRLAAPPWESAYASDERLLFQKETLLVRKAYLKYSFLPTQFRQEADDHLGLELDFMYQLCLILFEKALTGEPYQEILEDQKEFLEEHLLTWVDRFCNDVAAGARTKFYRGMAQILKGYLPLDRQAIEELLAE